MIRLLRKLFAGSARRDATEKAADTGTAVREGTLAEIGMLRTAGRNREAVDMVVRALASDRADAGLLLAHAELLLERDRAREALAVLAQLESCGVRDARTVLCAASAHLRRGNAPGAEALYRSALAAEPQSGEACLGLGMAMVAQRRFDEAAACFRQAHAQAPADARSLQMLGLCLLELADPVAAEPILRESLDRDDACSLSWRYLAAALDRQDRGDEALAAWERATRLEDAAGEGESFVPLAVALTNQGRIAEALALLERWLPRAPLADGHFAYAIALLTAGRLPEGWNHYEFRWLREPLLSTRNNSDRPAWAGQDLRDKTILLRIEQGYGDTFQFLRYARHVKALGARVLLKRFDPVAAGFPGVELLADDGPAPACDFYVNLLSLPRVFGTTVASIPADTAYLTAPTDRMPRWAARIPSRAGEFKVGLAWAGGAGHARDRFRSIAPEALAAVCTVPGVRCYSLQKGAAAVPAGVVDLGSALADFADTAAAIAQLDLVICVDTSVAHLAGALGKAVWVLLPTPADWRWLEGRDDSPWYPTMRLFRQKVRGDWDEVLARAHKALEEVVNGHEAAAPSCDPHTLRVGDLPLPRTRPVPKPAHVPGMSAVAATRYGTVQYLPDAGDEGVALPWYGEWLQKQLDLLERLVRPGSTVLEAGAGIGAHAVWLGRWLGADGHLLACEARTLERRILRQNLAANDVRDVTVLSDELLGIGSGAATVDALHLARLDWLKVSEGASAHEVLDGAGDTLWRLRPNVFASAQNAPAEERALHMLKAHGYRCWRHTAPLFAATNFNRRDGDVFGGRSRRALLAFPEELDVDVTLDACEELS